MKFCAEHWAALQAAVDATGLSSLIAESGQRAAENLTSELEHGSTVDNFDPLMSHVAPALMRRMIEARDKNVPEVAIWGSGTPRRELMFVDDAADAIVFVLERYSAGEPINIGIGVDVSIRELAELTAQVVGYRGALTFDASKPDGAPRRLLDNSRLTALGWRASTELADGLAHMYQWYCNNKVNAAA